jgi:tRNA dimethylallyltransferase
VSKREKRAFIPIPPPAPLPDGEVIDRDALLEGYLRGEYDLICVMGPTASGKTRYAVELARYFNQRLREKFAANDAKCDAEHDAKCAADEMHCEIISADSRQVYRRMDIGTGKDLAEYGEIPYHLIDIAEPGIEYNVYEYQRDFALAYRDVRERGQLPILCGGSGLYIEAGTCGYEFGKGQPREAGLPEKTFYIGTLVSREERRARIERRLDARLQEGMIEEIKGLIEAGVSTETLIRYGLEYKFVTQYILGEISYEYMRERLYIAICQFAKRQMTWLRGMEKDGIEIHWTQV